LKLGFHATVKFSNMIVPEAAAATAAAAAHYSRILIMFKKLLLLSIYIKGKLILVSTY
jgi:hypothetical protein